jgi:hypothetical protein
VYNGDYEDVLYVACNEGVGIGFDIEDAKDQTKPGYTSFIFYW